MKLKNLLIVVVSLAALSVLAWLLNRPSPAPSAGDVRVGRPVLDPAAADKAARVTVAEKGKSVVLVRSGDSAWTVESYHGLPADFSKLSGLVKSLVSADVERLVTASPERIARLEFADTRVAVAGPDGKPVLDLVLGKDAEGGGRFLRFDGENKAYLARLSLWLDAEPKNWADSAIVKFNPADIAKVSFDFAGSAPVVVSRADAKAGFSVRAPEGKRLKTDTVTSLLSTLSGLRFSDTSAVDDPKAAGAREAARRVTLTTFDGKTLAFAVGRQPERTIVKQAAVKAAPKDLIADAAKPAPAEISSEQSGPAAVLGPLTEKVPAGPVFAFVSHSDASNPVNALMAKRAFQVGEYVLTALPADSAGLFEDVPPAPPATPAAASPAPSGH